jgi:hypothetical protein
VGPIAHLAFHDALGAHTHGHGEPRRRAEQHGHAHQHEHPGDGAHEHHGDGAHEHPTAPRATSGFAGWRSHADDDAEDYGDTSDNGDNGDNAHGDERVPEQRDGVRHGEDPLEHGDGSLAHRDLAALLPLPGLPPVPRAPFAGYVASHTHRELPRDGRPTDSRARAPPASTNIPHPT